MLELKHFQQDYKMIVGIQEHPLKKLENIHNHIKIHYAHISEDCYAWLFSDECNNEEN